MNWFIKFALVLLVFISFTVNPINFTNSYTILSQPKIAVVTELLCRNCNAAHYNIGLMERVAKKRGLPYSDSYCSSPYLRQQFIGRKVVVYAHLTNQYITCTVADISADEHRNKQLAGGLGIELDYKTAKRLFNLTGVGSKPNRHCKVDVWLIK